MSYGEIVVRKKYSIERILAYNCTCKMGVKRSALRRILFMGSGKNVEKICSVISAVNQVAKWKTGPNDTLTLSYTFRFVGLSDIIWRNIWWEFYARFQFWMQNIHFVQEQHKPDRLQELIAANYLPQFQGVSLNISMSIAAIGTLGYKRRTSRLTLSSSSRNWLKPDKGARKMMALTVWKLDWPL